LLDKILVTGGAGFIGSALVRELMRRYPNAEIAVIDKLTYAGKVENLPGNFAVHNPQVYTQYTLHRNDIANFDSMAYIFKVFQPDTIFHLAAESHVDNSIKDPSIFMETNVIGTQTLLEANRQYNKSTNRFIHVSTDEVYGDIAYDSQKSFGVCDLLLPNSPYAASKAASDLIALSYCKTYGMDVVVTRCGNNYGPRQDNSKFIPKVIDAILNTKDFPLYNKGKNERDWLWVYDHVDGLIKAAEFGAIGGIYNFGTGKTTSNIDIIDKLNHISDKNCVAGAMNVEYVEDRLGHDKVYRMNYHQALYDLSWNPSVDLQTGLQKTFSWYMLNGGN
jgi:dTDP-glucose 4,6-dehydratase